MSQRLAESRMSKGGANLSKVLDEKEKGEDHGTSPAPWTLCRQSHWRPANHRLSIDRTSQDCGSCTAPSLEKSGLLRTARFSGSGGDLLTMTVDKRPMPGL